MNPSTENLLLREVQPRLRNAIHTVPAVGSDDPEELLQDGLVIALRLLNGTGRSRKSVTAAKVAYYTTKYRYRKADPLHHSSQLPETRRRRTTGLVPRSTSKKENLNRS